MKNFKFYEQYDAMQCGVACLRMVCTYYGCDYSFNFLSKYCHPTTEGVSLLGIIDAATKLGLQTECNRLTLSQLCDKKMPCILHWNQNHFVVLYKIKNNKYYVADPGKGKVIYEKSDFDVNWSQLDCHGISKGIALFLSPTSLFNTIHEETSKKDGVLYFFLKYLKPYKLHAKIVISGLLLGCLLQLILPFLTQAIVDIGIKNKNINIIWLILLGQLVLTISRTSVDFIRRWLLLHISLRINISLLSDFFIKLLNLPMSYFETKLMGDLLERMHDHSRVEKFLTSQSLSVLFALLTFCVFSIVVCSYSFLIFCIFLIGSLIYGIWILSFLRKRKKLDYELFEKQAQNNSYTYQLITSLQEIKLQNCEKRRRWEWEDIQADLSLVQLKSLKLQQTQEAGSIFINEIKNIIVTVFSATAVIKGDMSLGMMLAVQYIIGQLNSPIEQLMSFIYSIQDVKISLERINDIHSIDNENSKRQYIIKNSNLQNISLSNIEFKYDLHSPYNTLDNISFAVLKGKITAIVGASGSGKTTLIKLMLGYYPIEKGILKIGNININNINLKWWREQCGVVMQDGVIFSESIARNIAVDDGDIDEKRLNLAVEIANIKDYILSLPLKFNTKIGRDGIGLSQGQKQRILIARAVYKNPDYIFLDEATNSLDANNERAIVENLNDFYKGRTVVIVAHRLSTVKNADQIIVLDKGKVVEIGNHSSLIEKKGEYYNLVKNQLELGN